MKGELWNVQPPAALADDGAAADDGGLEEGDTASDSDTEDGTQQQPPPPSPPPQQPQQLKSAGGGGSAGGLRWTLGEVELAGGAPSLPRGAPYGFLYRNFATLHQYRRLFYVLDERRRWLLEFEDDSCVRGAGHGGGPRSPKAVINLQNARLEDELLPKQTAQGVLWFLKLFARISAVPGAASELGGSHSKTYTLGVALRETAQQWMAALKPIVATAMEVGRASSGDQLQESGRSSSRGSSGGGGSNAMSLGTEYELETDDLNSDGNGSHAAGNLERGSPLLLGGSGLLSVGTPTSTAGSASPAPAAAGSPPTSPIAKEWKQAVKIYNEVYQIPCLASTSNAWLLSEAIRAYIRRSGCDPDPELTALFNTTQHCLLDLGDDIASSVYLGDVLEAISAAPAPLMAATHSSHSHANLQRLDGGSLTVEPHPIRGAVSQPNLNGLGGGNGGGGNGGGGGGGDGGSNVAVSASSSGKVTPRRRSQLMQSVFDGVGAGLHSRRSSGMGSVGVGSFSLPPSIGNGWSGAGGASSLPVLSTLVDIEDLRLALESTGHFVDDRQAQSARLFDEVELLCRAMSAQVPFWPCDEWTSGKLVNGVRLFKSKNWPRATLGLISIPASPEVVLERLLDARTYHEWNPFIKAARYLEASKCGDVVHFETSHSLVRSAGNPLLAPRDFCVSRLWRELPDGTLLLLSAPTEHPCCAPPSGMGARGRLGGAIALRPVRQPQVDFDECLVVQLCSLELAPPFKLAKTVFDPAAQEAMVSALAGLREACVCTME